MFFFLKKKLIKKLKEKKPKADKRISRIKKKVEGF